PKPLKIAVAYENSSHGKEFLAGIQAGEKAAPDRFKVVFNETFDLNGKDYTSLLNKVKDANADAFMVDARVNDYITMQTQYKQLGMYHPYITYGPNGQGNNAYVMRQNTPGGNRILIWPKDLATSAATIPVPKK